MTTMRPLLMVVTGRPASGKTTLSRILSEQMKCPLIARDEMKEGYINTFRSSHKDIAATAAGEIYDAFFKTIELLLSNNISIVAEAAFQHKLWYPKLAPLMDKADIRIVICDIAPETAMKRFAERMAADPGREKFHGDSEEFLKDIDNSLINTYEAPHLPVPVLQVDTSDGYRPAVAEIIGFIARTFSPPSGFRPPPEPTGASF